MNEKMHKIEKIKKYNRAIDDDRRIAGIAMGAGAAIATAMSYGNFGISFDSIRDFINTIATLGFSGGLIASISVMFTRIVDLCKLKLKGEHLHNELEIGESKNATEEATYIVNKINSYDKMNDKSKSLAVKTGLLGVTLHLLNNALLIPGTQSLGSATLEYALAALGTGVVNLAEFGSFGAMLIAICDKINLTDEQRKMFAKLEDVGKSR